MLAPVPALHVAPLRAIQAICAAFSAGKEARRRPRVALLWILAEAFAEGAGRQSARA